MTGNGGLPGCDGPAGGGIDLLRWQLGRRVGALRLEAEILGRPDLAIGTQGEERGQQAAADQQTPRFQGHDRILRFSSRDRPGFEVIVFGDHVL